MMVFQRPDRKMRHLAAEYLVVTLIILVVPHLAQDNPACDVNYIGRLGSGLIQSPNYPFDYKDNLHCRYKIYFNPDLPSYGRRVCFVFYRFRLEDSTQCSDDYLSFTDSSGQQVRYCGTGYQGYSRYGSLLGGLQNITTGSTIDNVFADDFCWAAAGQTFVVEFFTSAVFNDTGFFASFTVEQTNRIYITRSTTRPTNGSQILPLASQAPCYLGEFTCFNRDCVPLSVLCDGTNDCADGSDESFTHARCQDQSIEACDFEFRPGEGRLCRFMGYNWFHEYSSPTGPRFDHTIGDLVTGYFVYSYYINQNYAQFIYELVPLESDTNHCFSLWYFMSGYVGTLGVNMTSAENENEALTVWKRVGNQGPQWRHLEVDIPVDAFPITQLVIFSNSDAADDDIPAHLANIAVDDISLLEGMCIGDDISCQFELGFCGWYNDPISEASWKRQHGLALFSRNGPYNDTSGNGFYIYIDSSQHSLGDAARLVSRGVNHGHTRAKCLMFWYYMAGESVNWLGIRIINFMEDESVVWSRSGDQGYQWLAGHVTLDPDKVEGPFQIVFEALVGEHAVSDIALDDVILQDGYCREESTTGIPTTTLPATCSPEQNFRCDSGHCIPSAWVCDGRFDCPLDYSDEEGCPSSGIALSTGTVIGIICGAVFIIIIIIINTIIFVKRRARRQARRPPNPLPDPSIYDYISNGSHLLHDGGPVVVPDDDVDYDPPPPYTFSQENPLYLEASGPDLNVSGSGLPPPYSPGPGAPAFTISIYPESNPPPSYSIVINSHPRRSSYTEAQDDEIYDEIDDMNTEMHNNLEQETQDNVPVNSAEANQVRNRGDVAGQIRGIASTGLPLNVHNLPEQAGDAGTQLTGHGLSSQQRQALKHSLGVNRPRPESSSRVSLHSAKRTTNKNTRLHINRPRLSEIGEGRSLEGPNRSFEGSDNGLRALRNAMRNTPEAHTGTHTNPQAIDRMPRQRHAGRHPSTEYPGTSASSYNHSATRLQRLPHDMSQHPEIQRQTNRIQRPNQRHTGQMIILDRTGEDDGQRRSVSKETVV